MGPLGGASLPWVIRPTAPGLDGVAWAKAHQEAIEQELLAHGAILFRGFDIDSIQAFERFASAVTPDLYGEYGDLPRVAQSDRVYKSTPYPREKAILFHNESSHMHRWPLRQWFHCVQSAEHGGETPIVDCRQMYSSLDPELAETFARKGLLYVRNFVEGLDVSWQSFFRTEDRAEVERFCAGAGIEFEWNDDESLTTRQRSPAVARHPVTEELVFFNQIQLHHVACLDPALRESLLAIFPEEGLPRNVYFGDGSPIDDAIVDRIGELYEQAAVGVAWQTGDVLLVDNMLVAHGRRPFDGERRIAVAMARIMKLEELAPV
jgi:alpha-ketoglutarate-dependent taurine dioxygenase